VDGIEGLGVFYIGRRFDLDAGKATEEPILYDAGDLTTHAVCVGMTGSGKTGLCISLLEEAVLDGIPAVVVDPKGDLANLLLTFPDLEPADFRPWVDEGEATQKGISADELAAQTASRWRDGLAASGQDGARIGRLKAAADFSIYTPGSDAGLPISVLGTLSPPPGADTETLADAVSSTVAGILGLLGIDADPIKSREHILMSTILAHHWSQGTALDLPGLIGAIQTPPVETIGVLPLESFYAEKDRFALSMQINNLLAAPGFQLWLQGDPLDAQRLLVTPEGRPRVSIFSIAHLSDAERMFFVTLLSNAMVSWMRAQSGTSTLRAIYYLDEVFGYFPPVAEPPSKKPLMTLLKQARAVGLGVVMATQNPADLDYKGLSNAGTWLIGRLQAERDKQRLLDGLEGASAASTLDRAELERIISGLDKRVFLMNNVHESAPVVLQSRFALSYLRGPVTREQVRTLMAGRAPVPDSPQAPSQPQPVANVPGTNATSAPSLPPDVPHHYLPLRGGAPDGATLHYVPMAFGEATVRIVDVKRDVDVASAVAVLAPLGEGPVTLTWDGATEAGVVAADLDARPAESATYEPIPAAALKPAAYRRFTTDLAAWLHRTQEVTLLTSARLKQTSRPGEAEGDFRQRLAVSAREARDAALAKLRGRYEPKLQTLAERERRASQAVAREAEQARGAKVQTAISLGSSILGAVLGRRRSVGGATTVLRGAGRVLDQSGDVGRARDTVAAVAAQRADLEEQFRTDAAAIETGFDPVSEPLETVAVRPRKADIDVTVVALAFAPYWRDTAGTMTAAWR
jgi:Helicase HerA, central domain